MTCLWCKKAFHLPEIVYKHAEQYGSETSHFRCPKCDGVLEITSYRRIVFKHLKKSRRPYGDWG